MIAVESTPDDNRRLIKVRDTRTGETLIFEHHTSEPDLWRIVFALLNDYADAQSMSQDEWLETYGFANSLEDVRTGEKFHTRLMTDGAKLTQMLRF